MRKKAGHFIVIIVASILISACAPTYQIAKVDPETGLIKTSVTVKPEEIKISVPTARVHEVKFVLVRASSGGMFTGPFSEFVVNSIGGFGFPEVIDREAFTQMVLASPLRDTVGNVTDPVALAKVSDSIGPFLIVDAVQVHLGDAWFQTRLRVTDASSAATVFEVNAVRLNWMDLDKEVNYPVLNALKRWIDESRALPVPPPKADALGSPVT